MNKMIRSGLGIGVGMWLLLGVLLAQGIGLGNNATEDVLHLYNGEIIYGQIVAQIPGESVTIELIGGSRLVYPQAEIERIIQVPARYLSIKYVVPKSWKPPYVPYRGWSHRVSLALGYSRVGQRRGLSHSLALNYRLVYQFRPALAVGLGGGIEQYEGGWAVPLLAELSGELWRYRRSGFFALGQAGYGFGIAPRWPMEGFQGGATYRLSLGWRRYTVSPHSWGVRLGYKAQHTREEGSIWGGGWFIRRRTYRAAEWAIFFWF